MKGFKIGIRFKILSGFLILICIFTVYGFLNYYFVNQAEGIKNELLENQNPSKDAVKELANVSKNMGSLVTAWTIIEADDHPKKAELKKITQETYPKLVDKVLKLSLKWKDQKNVDRLKRNIETFDAVKDSSQKIMKQLSNVNAYMDILLTDDLKKDARNLSAKCDIISNNLSDLGKDLESIMAAGSVAMQDSFSNLQMAILGAGLLVVIVGLIVALLLSYSIVKPVLFLQKIINELSKGKLPDVDIKITRDEIGDMVLATEKLVGGLEKTSDFAGKIGNGQLDEEFDPLSEEDVLGNSLLQMRENLSTAKVEEEKRKQDDEKRNWATEGLAKFAEILRSDSDIDKLSYNIITNLVKYLGANQGGIFILNEDNDEKYMELKGCYAFDRKKYVDKKILIGEGLVGQVWQEKLKVYMNDVPDTYANITSGLGGATPRSVLILPLTVNDEIFGIIEIASFNEIENYQIEFIERVGESIASSLGSVKINGRTSKLLEESQQMAEELRAQEEEMRQNMEELQATQEDVERRSYEMEEFRSAVNRAAIIIEYDGNGRILDVNKEYCTIIGYTKEELIGQSRSKVVKDESDSVWNDVINGTELVQDVQHITAGNKTVYLRASFVPIKNTDNTVKKIMCISHDITSEKELIASLK